jgi:hypothetical protein
VKRKKARNREGVFLFKQSPKGNEAEATLGCVKTILDQGPRPRWNESVTSKKEQLTGKTG